MKDFLKKIRERLDPPRTRTVLVIDDSDVDRTLVVRFLSRRYFVLTAASGKEGLDIAFSQCPDLILLDYMMPEMNGPEVCHRLKGDPRTESIPVIFLTSMDTPSTVVDGLEEGAEAYLIKPISKHDLIEQVALRIRPACTTGKDV